VTATVLLTCNGAWYGRDCTTVRGTTALEPTEARLQAATDGWTSYAESHVAQSTVRRVDLCPSCARATVTP
jgi:hypothetical protein